MFTEAVCCGGSTKINKRKNEEGGWETRLNGKWKIMCADNLVTSESCDLWPWRHKKPGVSCTVPLTWTFNQRAIFPQIWPVTISSTATTTTQVNQRNHHCIIWNRQILVPSSSPFPQSTFLPDSLSWHALTFEWISIQHHPKSKIEKRLKSLVYVQKTLQG